MFSNEKDTKRKFVNGNIALNLKRMHEFQKTLKNTKIKKHFQTLNVMQLFKKYSSNQFK
jgi:hypothetical protein